MGANFQEKIVDGAKTRNEVKSLFERVQEDDRYDNGHSYSGGFGMATGLRFDGQTFESEDAAREYLTETCQKWEEARCVTFKTLDNKVAWMIGAWCSS